MKRNFWKKTAAGLLALTLVTGALPANAPVQDLFSGVVLTAHAEVTASGFCGAETNEGGAESVAWSLDDSGVLTISGTGDMADYDFDFDFGAWQGQKAPWDAYAAVITSVIIESGVTSIGEQAFKGCTQLTSVTIPDRVTSIGEQAFSSCTNLTSVTIPDSVTSIGDNAFYACTSLASVTIPDSVTSIGDKAFYDCTSLTSVTIPGSVTSIGDNAFYDCTRLSTVTIPDSVTSIGNAAFYKCAALDTVIVKGTTPPALLELVFFYTDHNIKIYVPAASVDDYKSDENWSAYADRIESKVESGNCGAQGDNVKWELDLVTGVLTISGTGAMADYEEQTAPWYAFNKDITSAEIKSGVTSIGASAFKGCTDLESVIISEGLKSIGAYAFNTCVKLKSVTLPDGLKSIGAYAFSTCVNLKSITLPNSLERIGASAFNYCNQLPAISIPSGVKSIGRAAFETYSLKEAAVKAETPPELEGSLFSDYAIKAIYVPAASVDDYKSDAKWSAYADKISSYELADGQYKQSASKDGTYYTRFVYSVPKAQFAGKSKAKFTATYDGKDYTYETTSYYTGVISNGIEYTAASADSALFVVTISSGSYIYNDLTCTLDFE